MASLIRVGFMSRLSGLAAGVISYVLNWSRTDVFFNDTTKYFNDETQV